MKKKALGFPTVALLLASNLLIGCSTGASNSSMEASSASSAEGFSSREESSFASPSQIPSSPSSDSSRPRESSSEQGGSSSQEAESEDSSSPLSSEEPSVSSSSESSSSSLPAPTPIDAVTEASVDVEAYDYSSEVEGLTITYYTDILSRGFCWFTSSENASTELYLVEGEAQGDSAFPAASQIPDADCSCVEEPDALQNYLSHKAHVTGLKEGTNYSYKVGGDGHYRYGSFRTESPSIENIDILTFTDAQTKNLSLLSVWENSVAQAMHMRPNPDFILYDGDQLDVRGTIRSSKVLAYGAALDTIRGRIGSTPYMASLGNHDYDVTSLRADISTDSSGIDKGYYSFDYGFAHFATLNCNGNGNTDEEIATQVAWLDEDLAKANANEATKWIIVQMHNGPASTGDHSADAYTLKTAAHFTEVFSRRHVDLVIQGHDHTYSKTLPYRWDAEGKTTTYGNAEIVNEHPETKEIDGIAYDWNPKGTYYVTTGASGHRAGVSAGENDGVYADVTVDPSSESGLAPVNSEKTYLNNAYKTIVGTCRGHASIGTTSFKEGDPSTGNVDGQMFGALHLDENTLRYDFCTVAGNDVQNLDTLAIAKSAE